MPGPTWTADSNSPRVVVATPYHAEATAADAEYARVAVAHGFAFDLAVELQQAKRRDGIEDRYETATHDEFVAAFHDRVECANSAEDGWLEILAGDMGDDQTAVGVCGVYAESPIATAKGRQGASGRKQRVEALRLGLWQRDHTGDQRRFEPRCRLVLAAAEQRSDRRRQEYRDGYGCSCGFGTPQHSNRGANRGAPVPAHP